LQEKPGSGFSDTARCTALTGWGGWRDRFVGD
jgi:hypothetical protein